VTWGIKFQVAILIKKITFSRFVVASHQLVVLDESINGLDALMAKRIWYKLSSKINQRSVVLLSHDRPAICNFY